MLKGKELGQAIRSAIQLKLDSGAVRYQADIARHFGIKPPSIADWIKKGSISKDKLPELFRYFSDVVSNEHWGLTESEWTTFAPAVFQEKNSRKSEYPAIEYPDFSERILRIVDDVDKKFVEMSESEQKDLVFALREWIARQILKSKPFDNI